MKEFDCFAAQQDLCFEILFFCFKISFNYNDSKAMLNDLIVLGVIEHIFFHMHKNMKQLLRKRIKISLILWKEMMEFFPTSVCVI